MIHKLSLKTKAFVQVPGIGLVLPGVSINSADYSLQQKLKIARKPPRMQAKPILTNGTLVLEFDEDMMVPKVVDPEIYGLLFRIKLRRQELSYEGKFVNESSESQETGRRQQENDLENENMDIAFNFTVIEHSSKQIVIQIQFANKFNISTGINEDVMALEILLPEVFRSSLPPYMSLDREQIVSLDEDGILLPIPP